MKNYIPILVLFIILSCRKDPTVLEVFTAGSVDDVTVTSHDSLVQGQYVNGFMNTDYMYLDLDSDGINDLLFTSSEYLLDKPFDLERPNFYDVRVQIVNDIFSLAIINGSEQVFEHYSEPVHDYDGTWPRKTTTVTVSCDSLPNSKSISNMPTVNYLIRHYPISENLFWVNYMNQFVIRGSKFETLYYEGNSGPISGDSLIGFHEIYDRHCQSIPLNTQYYIPFKKNIGTKYKYGWILLDITDNNKIAIFESAIQNGYN
jgi:hypothetical protein